MAASEPSRPPAHPKPSGSRQVQNRKVWSVYSLSDRVRGPEGKAADVQRGKLEFVFFILVSHQVIESMCL